MMFSAFCPTHDARVLMTRRNVLGFLNKPDGAVIYWKCNCGHEGMLGRHGDQADPCVVGSESAVARPPNLAISS